MKLEPSEKIGRRSTLARLKQLLPTLSMRFILMVSVIGFFVGVTHLNSAYSSSERFSPWVYVLESEKVSGENSYAHSVSAKLGSSLVKLRASFVHSTANPFVCSLVILNTIC